MDLGLGLLEEDGDVGAGLGGLGVTGTDVAFGLGDGLGLRDGGAAGAVVDTAGAVWVLTTRGVTIP